MPSFDLRTGTPPKWPYNFSSKEEQGGMKNYAWVVFRGEKPGIYFDWYVFPIQTTLLGFHTIDIGQLLVKLSTILIPNIFAPKQSSVGGSP